MEFSGEWEEKDERKPVSSILVYVSDPKHSVNYHQNDHLNLHGMDTSQPLTRGSNGIKQTELIPFCFEMR